MTSSCKNQVALVTGAAAGLGLATASAFAEMIRQTVSAARYVIGQAIAADGGITMH